jgi:hypothetical protein
MFTYDVQYGGDPHDKYDLKGKTDYENFILAFGSFPWLDEIERSNENPDGCSPTLSVKNITDKKGLWVSMAGDRNNNGYLLGYVYSKTKKSLLSLGKEKMINWLEIYLTGDKQQIKEFFKFYFNKNYEQLHAEIKNLEMFGETEAQDL